MPDLSLDSFFFWNSGSEAVEAALKMSRIITGRQNIIAMQGAHGWRQGRELISDPDICAFQVDIMEEPSEQWL